jgi:hypothetical protein
VIQRWLGGSLAWRRFRRNFIGLRETLEELREDVLWLKEKSGEQETETDSEQHPACCHQ